MYTAIIVEPRKHNALSFVLHNFLQNLSNDWKIIVFCGNTNIQFLTDIINTELNQYINRITIYNLGVDNLTIEQYNILLTNKSFYDYIPTNIFLVFQTDTMIFEQNKDLIYDFMNYDYVGAPWWHNPVEKEHVGNGGLSLRRKKKMLEIIEKVPYNGLPEDVYFCYHPTIHIRKPTFEKAKLFSVEFVFSEKSFGCHKPWCKNFTEYYFTLFPEVKTLYELQNCS